MSLNFKCEFCKVAYYCKWKLNGHKRQCTKRKEQLAGNAYEINIANKLANEIYEEQLLYANQMSTMLEEEIEDDIITDLNDIDICHPSFIDAYQNATNAYITRQRDYFNSEDLVNLEAGFTKNLTGLRSKANIRTYLEICEFCSNCHGLSISECDLLVELIRRVSYINGYEIPVPSKYYTIHDKIFKALRNKSIRIVKTYYEHCKELFGSKNNLEKIPAVVTDILDMISQMFIDPAIYPYLHFDYEESKIYKNVEIKGKRKRIEDVVYSEFYNSEFFKRAEEKIRDQWGPVKIVPVFIGIDATNLNQSGSINATPVYLSLGNMEINLLRSHNGIELCGYLPVSLASKAKQRSALSNNGIQFETNQDDCIKLHSRWLEQEFLHDLLAPIRW